MIPVILSGGAGTRLWPLSREQHPKQYLSIASGISLFQETVERIAGLTQIQNPIVVCNEEHRFLTAEQLRHCSREAGAIILEPEGRSTAPAIALAAFHAVKHDERAVLLVLPADHIISNVASFHQAVRVGLNAARDGLLVTFGVTPTYAETGYGYIRIAPSKTGIHRVERFVEKPNMENAVKYFASPKYYWNSGIFLFQAKRYLDHLQALAPRTYDACKSAYEQAACDSDFIRVQPQTFLQSDNQSVDYAIMEKTKNSVLVKLDAGWNDLGSWSAVRMQAEPDAAGNVVIGDVYTEDTQNSYLRAENRLLATIGLDNHVVVETADAVLVAHHDRAQEVKAIVERLRKQRRQESSAHRRAYRPWGSFEEIMVGERFKVKRIFVNPGGCLSLQMHRHRSEHWIIVHGVAKVTRGEEQFFLEDDQSTYIPRSVRHRLENPADSPLELIEVQTGSYLGEDDIVRFEDSYGR